MYFVFVLFYISTGNENLFSALLVLPPLLIASFPGSHNKRDPGMILVGRGCALQGLSSKLAVETLKLAIIEYFD